MSTPGSYLKGYTGKLAVSTDGGSTYTDVGGIKSISRPTTGESWDVTSKDSGAFKEFIGGRFEGKLSADGLYDPTDAGQAALRTASTSRATVKVRYRPSTATGAKEFISDAIVTGVSDDSPDSGANTIKYELQLSGQPTEQAQA